VCICWGYIVTAFSNFFTENKNSQHYIVLIMYKNELYTGLYVLDYYFWNLLPEIRMEINRNF